MKVLIIGGLSLPDITGISSFIEKMEKIFFSKYHNHPWIYNLAKGLSSIEGNEIHVLSVTNLVSKPYQFYTEQIFFHLLPSCNKYINAMTFFLFERIKIRKYIKKINPDIIHAQSRSFTTYEALKSKYPVVVTNHGQLDEHINALKTRSFRFFLFKFYEKKVNQLMKYCIAVSPNCYNDCLKYLKKENIFLIENAINPIFFTKQADFKHRSVLFVGSVTQLKQVKELILAIKEIDNCVLNIIYQGYDKNYLDELIELIKHNNISERINLLGQKTQSEIANEMTRNALLCLPSTYESFGMVLAEAMAVGIPIVAANIEGPSFVLTDNVTGYLFESGNIFDLSNKISKLINDVDLCRKMGAIAKNTSFLRFSSKSVAKRTHEVYRKIAER